MDNKFEIIISKLENLEKGQQDIKQDLTIIKESVQRLEQSELTFKVESLESDLRLVKKIITNQVAIW